MLSKATELALKSQKTYLDNEEWLCFWHRLSDDELNTQIFTVGHKPTDQLLSFYFKDLSSAYKVADMPGVQQFLAEKLSLQDTASCADCVWQFLNDAKIEYTGKEYR